MRFSGSHGKLYDFNLNQLCCRSQSEYLLLRVKKLVERGLTRSNSCLLSPLSVSADQGLVLCHPRLSLAVYNKLCSSAQLPEISVVRFCSRVVAFNCRRTVVNPEKEPSTLSPCLIESLLSDILHSGRLFSCCYDNFITSSFQCFLWPYIIRALRLIFN